MPEQWFTYGFLIAPPTGAIGGLVWAIILSFRESFEKSVSSRVYRLTLLPALGAVFGLIMVAIAPIYLIIVNGIVWAFMTLCLPAFGLLSPLLIWVDLSTFYIIVAGTTLCLGWYLAYSDT